MTFDPASTCKPRTHGGPDAHGAVPWDFSTNVNATGPCPQAVEALARVDATRYPDPGYHALRERLANFHGVAPQRIVPAASASEFIQRVTAVGARLAPGPMAVPALAYGDYATAAHANGRAPTGPDDAAAALRWCCEPSSPLGQDAPPPDHPADRPTVLDAAYAPLRLHGSPTWSRDASEVVFQLFSPNKALGLPGVRGAYAIAPLHADWPVRAWCAALDRAQPSWPLGAHAVALLEAWTETATRAWLSESLHLLREWTSALRAGLDGLGLHTLPSVTPFLCARRPAFADRTRLRERGLAVRNTDSFGLPGHMRVSAQPPQALAALLTALHELQTRPERVKDGP